MRIKIEIEFDVKAERRILAALLARLAPYRTELAKSKTKLRASFSKKQRHVTRVKARLESQLKRQLKKRQRLARRQYLHLSSKARAKLIRKLNARRNRLFLLKSQFKASFKRQLKARRRQVRQQYRTHVRRIKKSLNLRRRKLKKTPINKLAIIAPVLVVAGVAGIIFFGFHLKEHYDLEPIAAASPKPKIVQAKVEAPKTLPASTPTEIDIPSLNIEAPIVPTDLSANGSIAVPNDTNTAGWYQRSPTPGQLGPSIIVGHVDYIDTIAVFWRLRYAAPGTEIDISRADGSLAKFDVDSIQQYSQDNFPDNLVYGNINAAGLRLITCGGIFDPASRHYNQNTVVFATLEQ